MFPGSAVQCPVVLGVVVRWLVASQAGRMFYIGVSFWVKGSYFHKISSLVYANFKSTS